VAQSALESYDLDVARLRLITNDTNGIFRVDTPNDRFVIRVGLGGHIGHSLTEVRSETEWLAALAAETDLTVPRPIPDRNGNLVVVVTDPDVPDPRNCVVFSWLTGPLLDERLDAANMAALGKYAAGLHHHGSGFRPSPRFAAPRYDRLFPFDEPVVLFDEPVSDLLPHRRRMLFSKAARRVEALLEKLLGRGEPMRVMHGDLHPWNVKVDRGRIAAFDFEDLMWGWPVQDIATTLYYIQGRTDEDELRSSFAAGYRSSAGWWPHQAEIDTFVAGRALVLANDVLVTPEWSAEAPSFFERAEWRLRKLLD
jgi:Ser/Thr protein kinase RdoA (MazF antagonist)